MSLTSKFGIVCIVCREFSIEAHTPVGQSWLDANVGTKQPGVVLMPMDALDEVYRRLSRSRDVTADVPWDEN